MAARLATLRSEPKVARQLRAALHAARKRRLQRIAETPPPEPEEE